MLSEGAGEVGFYRNDATHASGSHGRNAFAMFFLDAEAWRRREEFYRNGATHASGSQGRNGFATSFYQEGQVGNEGTTGEPTSWQRH